MATIVVADDTLNFPEGRIEFAERRLSTDPLVKAHPEVFCADGTGHPALLAHAGARHEAANAAGQAAAAARTAHEAEHGPIHLTAAEGGSNRA